MDHDQILSQYAKDGVVRVPAFFPAGDVECIRRELDRYIRDVAPALPEEDRVFEADGRSVRNLWRMQNHDPFFAQLAERPEILTLVACLVNGDPVLMAVESFCKPAHVGSAVPYHQDNAYFCQTPPDVLTLWVALDPATEANGAVHYVAGSHKLGILPHRASRVAGNSIGLADPPRGQIEYCAVLEPGDMVIHHSQVIHRSGPNTSEHSRRGLLLVYRGRHTRTDPQLMSAYEAARAALVAG